MSEQSAKGRGALDSQLAEHSAVIKRHGLCRESAALNEVHQYVAELEKRSRHQAPTKRCGSVVPPRSFGSNKSRRTTCEGFSPREYPSETVGQSGRELSLCLSASLRFTAIAAKSNAAEIALAQ